MEGRPALRTERVVTRSALASEEARLKRRPNDPVIRARVDELRAEYRALALEDAIRAVVDTAPPLTADHRAKLARLLCPSSAA